MSNLVFISYSSRDAQAVKKITQILNETGISYWKAPEMIPAGSNYAREIPRAIEKCQIFLLFLSEASQNSIWVEKEIDCAINYRKTIVPLNLTGEPLSDMFRFYLNNVQAIDYSADPDKAVQQLLERLQNMITYEQKPHSRSLSAAAANMELPKTDLERKSVSNKVVSPKERSNALRINQKPIVCQQCGGDMVFVGLGAYRCDSCGAEDYDSYRKIKNYLDKEGPKNMTEIARATGVPRSSVEYFLRDERLEIPMESSARLKCSGCGASIRTGVLCDSCKNRRTGSLGIADRDNASYRFLDRKK